MTALRALGVRTALDDFGSGYSSLAQVLITPVDEIKVDKRFMQEADPGRRLALTRAAVNLAQAIGAVAVVEGWRPSWTGSCCCAWTARWRRASSTADRSRPMSWSPTCRCTERPTGGADPALGSSGIRRRRVISRAERRSSGG